MELIKMERDAWEYARSELSQAYSTGIDEETIEMAMDSYRDWLHARSACTICSSTGIQVAVSTYRCLACGTSWKANEARLCALRRYTLAN
jgi:hypothetical protein